MRKLIVSRKILAISVLLIYWLQVDAQSLKRQCIASSSSLIAGSGISVQQTIGQPFATLPSYTSAFGYRPGFQQPAAFSMGKVNLLKALNLSIFPNPATNAVFVKSASVLENADIMVADLAGRVILNSKITNTDVFIIQCDSWGNGVYIVTVQNKGYTCFVSKLIISK